MKTKSVLIYTTPTCIWCAKTKEFLRSNKITFKELDVSSDRRAAHEMIQKSGQMGVPVVDIDGSVIVGFDEPRLRKLLGIK